MHFFAVKTNLTRLAGVLERIKTQDCFRNGRHISEHLSLILEAMFTDIDFRANTCSPMLEPCLYSCVADSVPGGQAFQLNKFPLIRYYIAEPCDKTTIKSILEMKHKIPARIFSLNSFRELVLSRFPEGTELHFNGKGKNLVLKSEYRKEKEIFGLLHALLKLKTLTMESRKMAYSEFDTIASHIPCPSIMSDFFRNADNPDRLRAHILKRLNELESAHSPKCQKR